MPDPKSKSKPPALPPEPKIAKTDRHPETTWLDPVHEQFFQLWAKKSGIEDLGDPEAKYDYRGFWLKNGPVPYRWGLDHLPDEFKQHGHPTFSVQSRYSEGPWDGGMWLPPRNPIQGEQFVPQPPMMPSHEQPPANQIAPDARSLLLSMMNRQP